jgi:hypothetical protein
MDRPGPTRMPRVAWLPWGLLLLTTGAGGTVLFGQIPPTPAAKPGSIRGPVGIEVERERLLKELQPGLPEDRVRELLGRPNRLARQVLHLRYLEQWVYDSPFPLRVEIEHPRGRPAQLLTVHPLTSEKP